VHAVRWGAPLTLVSPPFNLRRCSLVARDSTGAQAAQVRRCRLTPGLGWRYGIRTDSVEGRIRADSVEGRIRADSGGLRAAPQGISLRYCTVCMGILTLQKWVPDSDGFGRESDSDGFGRILGPQIWKSPTQPQVDPGVNAFGFGT